MLATKKPKKNTKSFAIFEKHFATKKFFWLGLYSLKLNCCVSLDWQSCYIFKESLCTY